MIKIKPSKFNKGFPMILPGSGGNTLTIFHAFGQSGMTNLLIIASDNGTEGRTGQNRIVYNSNSIIVPKAKPKTNKVLNPEEAIEQIHDAIVNWANDLENPAVATDKQADKLDRDIGEVMMIIGKKFGLTKTELADMPEMFTEKQNKKLAKHVKQQQLAA